MLNAAFAKRLIAKESAGKEGQCMSTDAESVKRKGMKECIMEKLAGMLLSGGGSMITI